MRMTGGTGCHKEEGGGRVARGLLLGLMELWAGAEGRGKVVTGLELLLGWCK
jgi:hypothetical protein